MYRFQLAVHLKRSLYQRGSTQMNPSGRRAQQGEGVNAILLAFIKISLV
jgi:hypothetical protein